MQTVRCGLLPPRRLLSVVLDAHRQQEARWGIANGGICGARGENAQTPARTARTCRRTRTRAHHCAPINCCCWGRAGQVRSHKRGALLPFLHGRGNLPLDWHHQSRAHGCGSAGAGGAPDGGGRTGYRRNASTCLDLI
jgi:hypothetical protein